jgi:hypothetical protein
VGGNQTKIFLPSPTAKISMRVIDWSTITCVIQTVEGQWRPRTNGKRWESGIHEDETNERDAGRAP